MPRRFLIPDVLAAVLCIALSGATRVDADELLPEPIAAQAGLKRAWFAQIEVASGRGQVRDVILYEGALYVQTNGAMLHALDAESGRKLWSQQIGRPEHPSMTPDAKGDWLAVVNGSRLYMVNRHTGVVISEVEIKDAPGAGAAVSTKRVFVPTITGKVLGFRLPEGAASPTQKQESQQEGSATEASSAQPPSPQVPQPAAEEDRPRPKREPTLFCQSYGRALVQPLVTRDDMNGEYVCWPTDRGFLYFTRVEQGVTEILALKFRLQTGGTIVARPAYLPPDPKVLGETGTVFAASYDGLVYAIDEERGTILWRFSTGEPLRESPAVVELRVYIPTPRSGLYCLDAKSGKNHWLARGATKFVAAGKNHVFAVDRIGRLLVLDASNGRLLHVLPTESVAHKLANSETDRIYLIGNKGSIQCFHEKDQTEPIIHGKDRKPSRGAASGARPVEGTQRPTPDASRGGEPADEENPF